MIKLFGIIFGIIFSTFFSALSFAQEDSSLSFTPPPTDLSVSFLGSLFGIVDGVLHGSGSQIMGMMFGVFNAAVLALGGIIIMYTLLVSTMNTAHEGQMLGQKWSSIWVPVRSILGLSLLIPKASGYCLMQIFVMWVVVQGIGAADKIWSSALSYLNRGGAIIIPLVANPNTSDPTRNNFIGGSSKLSLSQYTHGVTPTEIGAATILAGQVCMLGLENTLRNKRDYYLSVARKNTGPCYNPTGYNQVLCQSEVDDFLGSVSAVGSSTQQMQTSGNVPMPNLPESSAYFFLNGICGTISWNAPKLPAVNADGSSTQALLSPEEQNATLMSRSIAVEQMYTDLSSVAEIIVNNNPTLILNQASVTNSSQNFSPYAMQQFGIPYTQQGSPCVSTTGTPGVCAGWGPDPSSTTPPLFTGREFTNALADYNGLMSSTLNYIQEAQNSANMQSSRAFIQQAESQGWILAGSYFFSLATLNAAAISAAQTADDSDSGLAGSAQHQLKKVFSSGKCSDFKPTLCNWLQDPSLINNILASIDGTSLAAQPVASLSSNTGLSVTDGVASSTVNAFAANSLSINLQPSSTTFGPLMFPHVGLTTGLSMPSGNFDCSFFDIGCHVGSFLYNDIILWFLNALVSLVSTLLNQVMIFVLYVPMLAVAGIFQNGLAMIENPLNNPIVALANMGTYYINYASNQWLTTLLTNYLILALIPIWGKTLMTVVNVIFMPFILCWLGIMIGVGFITAYYVPFLPYMIFTFGALGWFMTVIEAMVAAPIVALGITHPEGEGAFGKGEAAIMILLNVFLRPAMMIIGYIAAIALSFVSVWLVNAGFQNVISFMEGDTYESWASIYAFFFCVIMYTSIYITVVQKSFTLITALPDRVLRWIGGQSETTGQEAAQWAEESKGKVSEAGTDMSRGVSAGQHGTAGKMMESALKKWEGRKDKMQISEAEKDKKEGGDKS